MNRMRLWRGLGTRIVAGSIFCGLLGVVVAWVLLDHTAHDSVQAGIAPYFHGVLDQAEMQRCSAAPEVWSIRLEHGGRLDAYDPTSLRSRNPDAPPLDLDLYARLEDGEPNPMNLDRFGFGHGHTILLEATKSGPCSLVQATFPGRPSRRRQRFYFLFAGSVVLMALAAALGAAVVVRPLMRRIDRLRLAANQVGASTGYSSAIDTRDDELGELSNILDAAHARIRADADELEEARLMLERHLSDVAHDLRTPIASLQIALSQAASANRDPALDDLFRGALKDVVYLSGLTANLRLAARLRDGWDPHGTHGTVDIADVAEQVGKRVRYFARNGHIALDVGRPDDPVLVGCDATAAEQVVTNLAENAVAYGDRGGHVAIVVESHNGRFSLTVSDDGPGVLPTELPRLGERTFRSDEARQRDPSGSGLGLAIASEVCSRCGWTLSFRSNAPRGLSVTIEGEIAA